MQNPLFIFIFFILFSCSVFDQKNETLCFRRVIHTVDTVWISLQISDSMLKGSFHSQPYAKDRVKGILSGFKNQNNEFELNHHYWQEGIYDSMRLTVKIFEDTLWIKNGVIKNYIGFENAVTKSVPEEGYFTFLNRIPCNP